jgi:hypothetical protein
MSNKENAASIRKSPDDWVSGDEPMTDAQRARLAKDCSSSQRRAV